MEKLLDRIRTVVRRKMTVLAKGLNKLTGGQLSPNSITLFGMLMHIPIALLIANQSYLWAGVLLLIFGLFDTLDGAMARVQGTATNLGMFLDSTTDRLKEVLVYIGITYAFVTTNHPYAAVWAVAACGISLTVTYINAWGEVALAGHKSSDHQVNKSLRSGLMSYDLRIAALVVGLLVNQLIAAVIIVTVLSFITALQRINSVVKKLDV